MGIPILENNWLYKENQCRYRKIYIGRDDGAIGYGRYGKAYE